MEWSRTGGHLAAVVEEQTEACLSVYRSDPTRVEQDANIELRIAEGGYRDRQLPELLQNAVDAASRQGGRRVEVHLTDTTLYVANDGAPFDADGVRSIMASDLSSKDDERIGRFGIGFKSVLAICDGPKILSRSVSFVFDRRWSEERLTGEGHVAARYPTMRLARVEDPLSLGAGDSHLLELMTWASTVVVLPLTVGCEVLCDRMENFPAEFVLFSRHIKQARLHVETVTSTWDRPITCRDVTPTRVLLSDGRAEKEWELLTAEYEIDEEVREDAGRIAGRASINVTWAMPPRAMHEIGTFWTYFPTSARTTLAGLINAPWQLSDDRANLIQSRLNTDLLTRCLPDLFAQSISSLHDATHPTRILDALPARGREQRSWADDMVNEPFIAAALSIACIPNVDGELRRPGELLVPPAEASRSWLEAWGLSRGLDRSRWVHPAAVATPERRLKVVKRLKAPPETLASLRQWLTAAAGDGSLDGSEDAIKLAAAMIRDRRGHSDDAEVERAIHEASIVLLEDGRLGPARRGAVHLRTATDEVADGTYVSSELAQRPGVREALLELGITVLDDQGQVERLLTARVPDWEAIWQATREAGLEASLSAFVRQLPAPRELRVMVRTAAGPWANVSRCLLPGRVLPAGGAVDAGHQVDPDYHAQDMELLRRLGAVSEPVRREDPPMESWRNLYTRKVTDDFREAAFETRGSRPDPAYIEASGPLPPWPLAMLAALSDESRARMTSAIVEAGLALSWDVKHRTSKTYGRTEVPSPEVWWLRSHGRLPTPFGPLPLSHCVVARGGGDEEWLPHVSLPDADANALDISTSADDLGEEVWAHLKVIADGWSDDARRAAFYASLDGRLPVEEVVVRVGSHLQAYPVAKVIVTSDNTVYDSMVEAHVPVLLALTVEDEAVFTRWGMQDGRDLFKQEIVPVPSGEALLLLDEYRALLHYLQPADHELALQRCRRLSRLLSTPGGQVERPVATLRDGHRVYVTASTPEQELGQVSEALALDLDDAAIRSVLEARGRQEIQELRRRIRQAAEVDVDLGLVEAIGGEALAQHLPRQALESLPVGATGDPRRLASLARAVHGVGILRHFRDVLELRGLEPPRALAGGASARQFVADLGFPLEWAGFLPRPRPALEFVDGRPQLPELHGFQKVVTANIKKLLAGEGPERGMVALPTGAGKTRVAVQALVEGLADGSVSGPVVWIAQSDELCEQAAETWSFLWRAVGPPGRLALGRLWAENEVEEIGAHHQVVIATDHKLDSIIGRTTNGEPGAYEWLRKASVVVVDEAHVSVQARYIRVLAWLGRSAGRVRTGAPLIGLSATPFRGNNEIQTSQLVAKFDLHRLDEGAFNGDPYDELRADRILARVQLRSLDGMDITFNDEERREVEAYGRVPVSVERVLGEDRGRTARIVDSIVALPHDWTVLLFAPSVENARTLAALLSDRGVPAVSVSAETETAARRHYVEEFKAGRIRVLTNQSVFIQGFDAPAVRAVYVTRPTFSPNVYQQMVGRGLRGPRNGGSEEVLIVNVQDNFDTYGDRLAFRHFDNFWIKSTTEAGD